MEETRNLPSKEGEQCHQSLTTEPPDDSDVLRHPWNTTRECGEKTSTSEPIQDLINKIMTTPRSDWKTLASEWNDLDPRAVEQYFEREFSRTNAPENSQEENIPKPYEDPAGLMGARAINPPIYDRQNGEYYFFAEGVTIVSTGLDGSLRFFQGNADVLLRRPKPGESINAPDPKRLLRARNRFFRKEVKKMSAPPLYREDNSHSPGERTPRGNKVIWNNTKKAELEAVLDDLARNPFSDQEEKRVYTIVPTASGTYKVRAGVRGRKVGRSKLGSEEGGQRKEKDEEKAGWAQKTHEEAPYPIQQLWPILCKSEVCWHNRYCKNSCELHLQKLLLPQPHKCNSGWRSIGNHQSDRVIRF